MTRFEKDLQDAFQGNEIEVLSRRRREIERLQKEARSCKNTFRRTCIRQEVERLEKEYRAIDENF